MLPKQNRLRTNKDFQKIFKSSKPIYTENLVFRVAKGRDKSRFGFVVSNKIDKRASRRNALRRRLRAIVQETWPQINQGFDVAIMVKQDFPLPYNYGKIKLQIIEGLKRANVIK
ncbi:MAG: ribonuclease P protein component [Patescibacteria group bacterium]